MPMNELSNIIVKQEKLINRKDLATKQVKIILGTLKMSGIAFGYNMC